jgi:hypothetical protein
MRRRLQWAMMVLAACGPAMGPADEVVPVADAGIPFSGVDSGTLDASVERPDAGSPIRVADPYADAVVRFLPGPGAGFGANKMPNIVLGSPKGAGASAGSLDVVSLGFEGLIELQFTDLAAVDGPGPDFIVFENGFTGFSETGVVSASADGVVWKEFACTEDGGCAGLHPVFANDDLGISAVDFNVSGGDGFDLAQVGLSEARYIRVKDSGKNKMYGAPGGGFDLDAVAVIHGRLIP